VENKKKNKAWIPDTDLSGEGEIGEQERSDSPYKELKTTTTSREVRGVSGLPQRVRRIFLRFFFI